MQSPANSTNKTANNHLSVETTPNYIHSQNNSKSEPVTQIQKDSVITRQDLPDKRVRYAFTLVILSAFLFVIAIYYGIINP
ncbi:hypothetical protein [Nostoc sp. FACHB-280]|uniref:hypothetical protein n=1 Tax=Nostoc sp. FACHB-280 TaxID=2692839 RepID=UPI00168B66BA|nr:hypothetical protein [Nostoc sp. FACHB-280]MBD2493674.1 hypothetical protein [Nostoc sp. FACHB-280]